MVAVVAPVVSRLGWTAALLVAASVCLSACVTDGDEPVSGGVGADQAFRVDRFSEVAQRGCRSYRRTKRYRFVSSENDYRTELKAWRLLRRSLESAQEAGGRNAASRDMIGLLKEREEQVQELIDLNATDDDDAEWDKRYAELRRKHDQYNSDLGVVAPRVARWERALGIPDCTKPEGNYAPPPDELLRQLPEDVARDLVEGLRGSPAP